MPGLDSLKKRVAYHGGRNQQDRMIQDKARSLNKALLYSYQSATAVLSDGREFRCLINPNKLSMELDDKMLSIPFEDICLNKDKGANQTTSQGIEPIDVKCGDIIEWKENHTHWIIYSQYLQEVAYFRGLMRQCEAEPLEINGVKHWYYLKGPDEKGIDWQKSKSIIFNNLNYTLEIYISNTPITNQFFQRFTKCKIKGQNFEVQAVDRWSTEGIIAVYLKEDYSNDWEEAQQGELMPPSSDDIITPVITGPAQVYPYDIVAYSISGVSGGTWKINNNKAKITQQTDTRAVIEVITGKSGQFILTYCQKGMEDISLTVEIDSL